MSASDQTVNVVAATLRTIAEQVRDTRDRDDLLTTAEQVEAAWDDACCPLCQEVTCDTGCPLSEPRASQDAVSGQR